LNTWENLNKPTFCRVTQLGFLRLLCNPKVMGTRTFEPEDAWDVSERLIAEEAIHFRDEPSDIETALKALTRESRASRDFWTDAYLAAFAMAANMRLVSFDSGFKRFKSLDYFILG
jgi:toxin-antitoxin system PIN domain toxin